MLTFALALAAAGPVYLRCTFDNGPVLVTADETNSTVSVAVVSTGYASRMGAAFTASEVRFENNMLRYVIDRTNLKAKRTIKLLAEIQEGQCQIEEAPKRAF